MVGGTARNRCRHLYLCDCLVLYLQRLPLIKLKLYLIAGEASGDLHGANLIRALKTKNPSIRFRAWGGDQIGETGTPLVKHVKDLAFMGFVEVLKNIRIIKKNFELCKKDIQSFAPDAIIFIDYPGFNLRIAKWAKAKNYKTIYYISPQVWAWNSNRVQKMKKFIDRMICILPFEKAFYKKYDWNVSYVGHPLLDHVNKLKRKPVHDPYPKEQLLVLMPGSRKQEIRKILPTMLEASKRLEGFKVILAAMQSIGKSFYEKFELGNTKLVFDQSDNLLQRTQVAWISSGTATLQAAMHQTPQVVCYKANKISYSIAKKLINVPYISLVNLIANKKIVVELIQGEFTVENLLSETKKVESSKTDLKHLYQTEVLNKLGQGSASLEAAQIILAEI